MKISFLNKVIILMTIMCSILSFLNFVGNMWLLQDEMESIPSFGLYRIESIESDRIRVSKYEQDLFGTERFVVETKTFPLIYHHDAKIGGFISKSNIWHKGETRIEYLSEGDAKKYFGWELVPATE